MQYKSKSQKSVILILIILFMLGLVVFLLSFVPFDLIKHIIDSMSYRGSANTEIFNHRVFNIIVIRLRLMGLFFIICSFLLYFIRQKAINMINNIHYDYNLFKQHIIVIFLEAIKEDGKLYIISLGIISIIAIIIRLNYLFQPMRFDEALSFISYSSKPLFFSLSYYPEPNNHLFNTFLVHILYLLLGNHPWVIRLPAFFAGICIIPVSYIVSRIFYNKGAAIMATGLVSSSSILIEYSTNGRGYTLICLFFLIMVSLTAYLRQERNLAVWLIFCVITSLGFYTIPIMLYPFMTVMFWLTLCYIYDNKLGINNIRDIIGFTILTFILTIILYIPVIVVNGIDAIIGNIYVKSMDLSFIIKTLPDSLIELVNLWIRDLPIFIIFLLLIGLFSFIIFYKKYINYPLLLFISTIACLFFAFFVQRVIPFNRIWMFLLPLYFSFSALGLSYVVVKITKRREKVISILLAMLFCSGVYFVILNKSILYSKETGTLKEAESITLFLKDRLNSGDSIIASCPSTYIIFYYFNYYGMPLNYFYSNYIVGKMLYVVVNEGWNQKLNVILMENQIDINRFKVVLKKKYESASLIGLSMDNSKEIR